MSGQNHRSLLSTLAAAAFVSIPLYVAPALAAAYIVERGFRPDQPSYVIAAEMAGMGAATLPALWWLRRWNWTTLARVMLLCIAAGNVASMFATGPMALGIVRGVTGLAQGTISIIGMSVIRTSGNPDRNFGWWLFAQLVLGGLALAALPSLLGAAGVNAFFSALAGLSLLMIWPAGAIPSPMANAAIAGAPQPATGKEVALARPQLAGASARGIFVLLAVLAFYIAFSSLWAVTAQIGQVHGVSLQHAGYALSLAPLGGILGAALAAMAGRKVGTTIALLSGIAIFAAAAATLGASSNVAVYSAAAIALMFSWTFVVPFLLGLVAKVDVTGQLTAAVNIIIGAGLAAGPMLSGFLIRSGAPPTQAAVVGIAVALASAVLALPALRQRQ